MTDFRVLGSSVIVVLKSTDVPDVTVGIEVVQVTPRMRYLNSIKIPKSPPCTSRPCGRWTVLHAQSSLTGRRFPRSTETDQPTQPEYGGSKL